MRFSVGYGSFWGAGNGGDVVMHGSSHVERLLNGLDSESCLILELLSSFVFGICFALLLVSLTSW